MPTYTIFNEQAGMEYEMFLSISEYILHHQAQYESISQDGAILLYAANRQNWY